MAGRVAAPVFARIADNLVDAFVTRAERVLGVGRAAAKAPHALVDVRVEAPAAERVAEPAPLAAAAPFTIPPAEPNPPPIGAAMTDTSLLTTLRASKLAAELTDDECRMLAEAMELRPLKTGEVLVQEGQADEHFYLIVRGVLGVVKGVGTADQVTLNTLSAGDFAGELSWLDGAKRYASLTALAETEVLGLERAKLEALLPRDPWLVYRVMRAIIRAVHQIQYRLSMQQSELSNYIYKQHGKY